MKPEAAANPTPSETPMPTPPAIPTSAQPPSPPLDVKHHFGRWMRYILAGNPFYILSAVLVLWSMDRLSIDSRIFSSELPQLYFNVSAFQVYEAMLVVTAIFLAGRGIAYDSGLLVGMENLLIAVPFILVSQVLLTESPAAMVLCAAGCILAIARIGALKRYVAGIQMPVGLMAGGLALLAANLAMPMVMRAMHKDVDFAVWYQKAGVVTSVEWLLLAPLCAGIAFLLPKARPHARVGQGRALYLQPYFPLCVFLLWVAGTLTHFYCIGYVYGIEWEWAFLIPAVWMTTWVLWNRADDFDFVASTWRSTFHRMLSLAPIATLLWAMGEHNWRVCFGLAAANAIIYLWLGLGKKTQWFWKLSLVSLAMAVGSMPLEWLPAIGIRADRPELILGAVIVYLSIKAVLSRNPKMGIMGAILVPCAVGGVLPWRMIQTDFALVQIGLVFLLLHSLRWNDERDPGASNARIFAAALWVGNSTLWLAFQPASGVLGIIGSAILVLAACWTARVLKQCWGPWILPASAAVVLVLKPIFLMFKAGSAAVDMASHIPIGLVILGAGFGMFAIGTLLALSRQHGKSHGK